MKKSLMAVGVIIIAVLAAGIYFVTKARLLPTQLTVIPSTPIIKLGEGVTLTATLTSNGAPVEGKTIKWSTSPEIRVSFPSLATDSVGQVSVSISPNIWLSSAVNWPKLANENGRLIIIASFASDNGYQGSSGSTSVVFVLS